MVFKEGDHVILSPGSRYAGLTCQIVGTGRVIHVKWEEDGVVMRNMYAAEDLLPAKDYYIQLFKKHYK